MLTLNTNICHRMSMYVHYTYIYLRGFLYKLRGANCNKRDRSILFKGKFKNHIKIRYTRFLMSQKIV